MQLISDEQFGVNNLRTIQKSESVEAPHVLASFIIVQDSVRLKGGWVNMAPCVCVYCLKYAVESHGTHEEKAQFNRNCSLTEEEWIPVNRKMLADRNNRNKHLKRKYPKISERLTNKELACELRLIKAQGISILRRGKRNIYDNLLMYCVRVKGRMKSLYIPFNNAPSFIMVVDTFEELLQDVWDIKARYDMNNTVAIDEVSLRKLWDFVVNL